MIKPVKIIPRTAVSGYNFGDFSFSIVTPINGTQYAEIVSTHSCREVVSQSLMKACANNGRIFDKITHETRNIPYYKTNKIRIATYIPVKKGTSIYNEIYRSTKNMEAAITERAFAAKRILNVLEAFAGFGKTNVIKANKDGSSDQIWIFNGPKGWLFSSQLMSLYMLIIRIGFCVRKKRLDVIDSARNIDEFISSIKHVNTSIVNETKNGKSRVLYYERDLTTHMIKIINQNMLKILFNNRRKLFDGIDRFPHDSRVRGGITSMCEYTSHSKKLNKSFMDMVAKGDSK